MRWLAWFSLPIPILFTLFETRVLPNEDDSWAFAGLVAGWICIGLSRPNSRPGKWIWFALYPIVMIPLVGLVGFLTSKRPMRLF